MSSLDTLSNEKGQRVRASSYFKLKRQLGKHFLAIDLKQGFGFIPEQIIIERDTSRSNVIRVIAILTPDEIKKEDKALAEREEQRKKIMKQIEADKKKVEAKKGGQDGSAESKPTIEESKA